MLFSRRSVSFGCLLLALSLFVGCDQLSFMPQAKKKKVTGYDAVQTGMSEKEVVKLLGEPNKRTGIDLEGTGKRARTMTYVTSNQLVTITFVGGAVIGKQKF